MHFLTSTIVWALFHFPSLFVLLVFKYSPCSERGPFLSWLLCNSSVLQINFLEASRAVLSVQGAGGWGGGCRRLGREKHCQRAQVAFCLDPDQGAEGLGEGSHGVKRTVAGCRSGLINEHLGDLSVARLIYFNTGLTNKSKWHWSDSSVFCGFCYQPILKHWK